MAAIEKSLHLLAEPALNTDAVAKAKSAWALQQWPSRKTEAWKYTPLKALADGRYFNKPASNIAPELDSLFTIENTDSIRLVFVDGVFTAGLSTDLAQLPEGLQLTTFAAATSEQQALISENLDKAAATHATLFGQFNTASVSDGALVVVAKNARIEQPIHLVNVATSEQESAANSRLLWLQERHSEATCIEHFVGANSAKVFTHNVTELLLADSARCEHYRLHLEPESCLHIGGVYSQLEKNAVLNSFYLAMGTELQRVDVVTQFKGEGAEASNNGVYLPRHQQLVDFHTCIEHEVPHCTSNEIFRGIIGDSARAVFNGRIHIHKDAQKTLAELSNKNLLTSDKAEVNTKPELEIYADDVRCAHGATVAELDELALHYLRTRGISREAAQVMLSFGFINELIDGLSNTAIQAYLKPIIAERFGKNDALTDDAAGC